MMKKKDFSLWRRNYYVESPWLSDHNIDIVLFEWAA